VAEAHADTRSKRGTTKTKMLLSAAEVLRERGAAGVTIDEVLARSGAPRGSVYHHFPGGRHQILVEALRFAGDSITASIDQAATEGSTTLLDQFVDMWERALQESDFSAGCPVMAAAMGSSDEDARLAADAARIFEHWHAALTRTFLADGFETSDAAALATTSIAAVEGAVVLCRSLRSTTPLKEVSEQIEFLISARKFVRRHTQPSRFATASA
jgi:TetR/AcrR family transcriptional repressor of lmrAB and yxaGH operons